MQRAFGSARPQLPQQKNLTACGADLAAGPLREQIFTPLALHGLGACLSHSSSMRVLCGDYFRGLGVEEG